MSQRHSIRLPGVLLDELKTRDYDTDERFHDGNSKKGKRSPRNQLSRKERRKQQRLSKKYSTGSVPTNVKQKSNHRRDNAMNNVASTAKLPNKKDQIIEKKKHQVHANSMIPPDDELSSDDFEAFDEEDLDEEEWEQLRELEADDSSEAGEMSQSNLEPSQISDNSDDNDSEIDDNIESDISENADQAEMTIEETMAALKAMKERKNKPKSAETSFPKTVKRDPLEMTVEETMEALKNAKNSKKQVKGINVSSEKKTRENGKDQPVSYPLAPADRVAMERDEMDMQYYAKKLGMKGKSKKLHARDEYDAIGGLLEGLDFIENFGMEDEEYGSYEANSDNNSNDTDDEDENEDDIENSGTHEVEDEELQLLPPDDELSSDDFEDFEDDDLNEEEWEQLRELENSDEEGTRRVKKENPLIAPVEDGTSTYIPPSMRKRALNTDETSALEMEVQKKVKSALNKLSDSNITVIISSLNELYDKYARQYVTNAITKQTLDIIGQRAKLLDGFIMNYAAVVYALWKLRGNEVGALYIQHTVEEFLKYFDKEMVVIKKNENDENEEPHIVSKECSNILGLLSYTYNFGLVSCNLLYDIIRVLVSSSNELTAELLLRIISISGPLIRSDDASALKDIISLLLTNVKSIKKQSPRLKFLLDTMSDLKNNRLKPSILAISHRPLKKTLQNVIQVGTIPNEPLLVSLEDIKNVEQKGKWWLIGASWKGETNKTSDAVSESSPIITNKESKRIIIEDDLLDDIPDWSEIARQQRMNTDVRRAIFISIMSAQDYMDAFSKLEKLNLKNKQSLEIPKVLLHCLTQDHGINGYNPYYGLLAVKLCENHHFLTKSFQFLFWDLIKSFEDEGEDEIEDSDLGEDARLKALSNKGKFFGYLLGENVLQLDIFKHVSLVAGLDSDGVIFVEFLLYQLLLTVAKRSELKGKTQDGKKAISYQNDILIKLLENGIKLENRSIILKGFSYFTNKNFKYKRYITGKKGSKAYERDTRRMEWASEKFLEIIERNLESINM